MPIITAKDGDTLCTLAINNGFKDCLVLRALPQNSDFLSRALRDGDQVAIPDLIVSDNPSGVDDTHKFQIKQREVGIRFVHGSPNLPFDQDLDLNLLNISNFTTNRAGASEGASLAPASHVTFDANSDADGDAFKVEVIESRPPGGTLSVIVEPIRATYSASGVLSGHVLFDGDPKDAATDRGDRSLITQARKVAAKRFRTGYLRLVVDDTDQISRPQQTVLVTDKVISGDSRLEVLDQDVRATYFLHDCPASPDASKCHVEKTVEIGRGRFIDLALHVLRTTPTGVVETTPGGPGDDGLVKLKHIQDRVNTFCRRHWAQDLVKFKIISQRTVDLPSDMLTVGDATGNVARGADIVGLFPGKVGFTLRVQHFDGTPNSASTVQPILINAGDSPEQTAGRLRDAIQAVPGFTATVSVNPPEAGHALGSADILIREASGGRITVTDLSSDEDQDADQKVAVARLGINLAIRNDFADYHVGHPQERNLFKSLDTGDDHIDVIVINTFTDRPQLDGFTICSQSDLSSTHQPLASMHLTVAVDRLSADDTNGNAFVLPHEIGHALLDCALHADSSRQLMFPNNLSDHQDVNDTKRLIALDPPANNWDNMITRPDGTVGSQRIRMNTLSRVLDKSGGLLHS